jgi:hypothetical protein
VLNLGDDLGRLRDRVLKLQKHYADANEDIRQILISADKIEEPLTPPSPRKEAGRGRRCTTVRIC